MAEMKMLGNEYTYRIKFDDTYQYLVIKDMIEAMNRYKEERKNEN